MVNAGDHIQISLDMTSAGERVTNVWNFRVVAAPATPGAGQVAQAWWQEVRDQYRALALPTSGFTFDKVRIEQSNSNVGYFAEYLIPLNERDGTRSPAPANGVPLASFIAVGARLSVGSRATRPGQKRFAFLTEGDVSTQRVDNAFIILVNNLLNQIVPDMTLNAPAAATALVPEVYGKGSTNPPLFTYQDVTGFLVNPNVTSQNSRKVGRGE